MHSNVFNILLSKLFSSVNPDPELRVSPERGNVAFASTDMAWCFTLQSFAQMYADTYGEWSQNKMIQTFEQDVRVS